MRTLYLECGMGAAGDMLTGALLELMPDPDQSLAELNSLGLPGIRYSRESSVRCGICGTHISVTVDGMEEDEHMHDHDDMHAEHHHHHQGMAGITHIIEDHLQVPAEVRKDILAVYQLIAEAESHVHGVPAEEIHFHEVGTMDAIADVTAVCLLLHQLHPDQVLASPIHVGSGQVRAAHGILPVPAPATAWILRGVPISSGEIQGELCTPTGAALLKHFVSDFGPMPVMRTEGIGYGMGRKEFPAANCVRAMIGETEGSTDEVVLLSCNVDDMTGEEIGFATQQLLAAGARDVYTIPIGMKKSRPGTLITVVCTRQQRSELVPQIFRLTSTLGIRESISRRYILDRRSEQEETSAGMVRRKEASGYGVRRSKLEYEDAAAIAREKGISLAEVEELIRSGE